MSTTNGISPSVVKPATSPATKPRRSKVKHMFWTSAATAARELGVFETLSICGRAWVPCEQQRVRMTPSKTIEGKLERDIEDRHCKECVRIANAFYRRYGLS